MARPKEKVTELLARVRQDREVESFQELHWSGPFLEYLETCLKEPRVARNAFQRLYDMILSHGTEEVVKHKERIVRYRFFSDPLGGGQDAVFGLERPLQRFVNVLKAAACGFGAEKRILLLHGPVGSAKSTIVRLLKRGLEHYSRSKEGALYTFSWRSGRGADGPEAWEPCPMHEDPLRLFPASSRAPVLEAMNAALDAPYRVEVVGDLCPSCRMNYRLAMERHGGDWNRLIEQEIRVHRLVLSEKDRLGIGTFQPKDEKNQDSTELTGDINYRKIAEYGSDSDPRAFNFDGEFNVSNRGIVEFIEVLKLDVAFLYDLLGASQEHSIKPKKFAQTDIDEVILGHSVAGRTPIPFRHDGRTGWTTLEGLHERFGADAAGLEVLAWDFAAGAGRWTPVRRVLRHRFAGEFLTTSQKWGVVETTPNHSLLDRAGEPCFPEEEREAMAVRAGAAPFSSPPGEVVDALEGVPGFVLAGAAVTSAGGPMTRPARPGWGRLDRPRHATQVRALYDPLVDDEALRDLLTVMVWYATEGHRNARNGGVVISQADPAELERVRGAYGRISTGRGSIDAGAKTDSAWRLCLGSEAIARLLVHHCGEGSPEKRLPDFLFRLPEPYLRHAFDELMRTDGTRRMPAELAAAASPGYRERFFEYKTISPVLAAQVGTLATLLGLDYSVYRRDLPGRHPAYRIRFVSGSGKRGGRRISFENRLTRRPAEPGEWAYDVECEGIHNFVCGVGNLVVHNTNEPEYRRLQSNELMEAFRDRTVKIDMPYNVELDDEVKIYTRDFGADQVRNKHIAPHTLEMAAMWAVLTRLQEPKKANLAVLQKLKLYNGRMLPGYTEDTVRELREEAPGEAMTGISPRYVQDKVSNALVMEEGSACINPFIVMNELESGLVHHSLITSDDMKKRYRELLALVKREYEDVIKNEVQRAISADEEAIARLCANYIDNIKAYTQNEKVKNRYTGQLEEPDERLMRSIEQKIDIPESRKDDFRREIMNYIGALAVEGRTFDYRTNERLQKALELKLFEDQKDSIKLTSIVSAVVDRETQEKIDVVKGRLVKNYGYCDTCATDVLNFVASIFARGDARERDE
jgi:serine protein kinase